MTRIIRAQLITLLALVAALTLTVAACGGGSSSAGGGGGSGSTILGKVESGFAAVYPSGTEQPLILTAVDFLIEPAHAQIVTFTVQLLDASGEVVGTDTTGADGSFVFNNLAAGNYSIRILSSDGAVLGQTAPFDVDPNTRTELELDVDGTVLSVEVSSQGGQIVGEVDNDSLDNDSGDDQSSDLDSVDDEGSDDLSSDDQLSDDGSSDDLGSDDDSSGSPA